MQLDRQPAEAHRQLLVAHQRLGQVADVGQRLRVPLLVLDHRCCRALERKVHPRAGAPTTPRARRRAPPLRLLRGPVVSSVCVEPPLSAHARDDHGHAWRGAQRQDIAILDVHRPSVVRHGAAPQPRARRPGVPPSCVATSDRAGTARPTAADCWDMRRGEWIDSDGHAVEYRRCVAHECLFACPCRCTIVCTCHMPCSCLCIRLIHCTIGAWMVELAKQTLLFSV